MSRNLTGDMAAGISAAVVRPILLLEAEFSETAYLWTGLGTLAWNGHDWLGIGGMIEISPIQETDSIEARGISVKVSGCPQDMVDEALGELRTSRSGIVRLALDDGAGGIVASPKIIFRGRLDYADIDGEDPGKPVINLRYENELIDLKRPREWRYTDAHQIIRANGDRSLRFISSLADLMIYWGR